MNAAQHRFSHAGLVETSGGADTLLKREQHESSAPG
jgi:hypothetical protein